MHVNSEFVHKVIFFTDTVVKCSFLNFEFWTTTTDTVIFSDQPLVHYR